MPNSNPPMVRAALLLPLLHYFEERGGDLARLLDDMEIAQGIIKDVDQSITVKAVYETMAEIAVRLGDPFVGATVGRDMARNAMGPLTAHMVGEQSVGSLLDQFLVSVGKYGNSTSYRLENDGRNVTLKMIRKVQPDANPAQPDALALALLIEQIRPRVGSAWTPRNVLAVVADETVVPEWLLPRSSLITGSKMGLTLRIPAQWMVLNQALPNGGNLVDKAHKEYGTMTETVQSFCRKHLSDPKLDIARAARACRLHPKALSRMLCKEGTSFKTILEEQRREYATKGITEGMLSVTDVAFRTGFTQPSNFARAYKRWTGLTPTESRKLNAEILCSTT